MDSLSDVDDDGDDGITDSDALAHWSASLLYHQNL